MANLSLRKFPHEAPGVANLQLRPIFIDEAQGTLARLVRAIAHDYWFVQRHFLEHNVPYPSLRYPTKSSIQYEFIVEASCIQCDIAKISLLE